MAAEQCSFVYSYTKQTLPLWASRGRYKACILVAASEKVGLVPATLAFALSKEFLGCERGSSFPVDLFLKISLGILR